MLEPTNNIMAIILAGGRGSRLYPLTKNRVTQSIPLAGKQRLIDISINNCIKSGIYQIAVLSQFRSVSLSRHISGRYPASILQNRQIEILTADSEGDLYQGTADGLRKQIHEIASSEEDLILVLPGDDVCNIDFLAMAKYHKEHNADITVAVKPVSKIDVSKSGVMKRESDGAISSFVEKPKDATIQKAFVSREDPEKPFLGSVSIYLFNKKVLVDFLRESRFEDIGGDIIPSAIMTHLVFGFELENYLEKIWSIRSYYEFNLALTDSNVAKSIFELKNNEVSSGTSSGSSIKKSSLDNVLVSEGCLITNADIKHSSIGVYTNINSGTKIKDSIILGADYYDNPLTHKTNISIGIGEDCAIEGAILDKNVRVGDGVVIKPFPRGTDIDNESWYVRDGIVIIPKNGTILPNTKICP